jgi:polygalacturonase
MLSAASGFAKTAIFDVKDFGAVGDGKTMDTRAIQAAIDACIPGGQVRLHDGTFLSATLHLKSDLTLFIEPTATLLGSGETNDYNVLNPPMTNGQKHSCDRALVYAEDCTNVVIDGGGTINGNGRTHFRSPGGAKKVLEMYRPIAIWTAGCNQVALRNIKVVDAGMWSVVNMQSDHLTITNVSINDHGLGGNRDGFDVVDCWHVVIADCTIDSGDDAICIKSGSPRGVNDLLVKNCNITKSQSNGIKFGTASMGPFTHIKFQDITLHDIAHSAMAIESVDGSAISDLTFERIRFTACQNAIFINLGKRRAAAAGSIDGITFRDITGSDLTDTRGCPISGCSVDGATSKVRNLDFDNVNIAFKGGVAVVPSAPLEYAGEYPENTMWDNLPAYGYYLRHVENVTFTNCTTGLSTADVRLWLGTNDVTGLVLAGTTHESKFRAASR